MPLTVEQFSERLLSSGIMSADQWQDWLRSLPVDQRPNDGESMASELVRQQRLTRYQADQICAGKQESLVLGNYTILDILGQGGMGLILKALHRRMERIVAIKVMSPAGMQSPDAVQRFHREVRAAAKLSHPNIVAAHDADEAKGTHFLVMEYVDGTDLSALVKRRGPLLAEQAVKCIIQAARGLEFAHEQGIVHRDIKPANLLVDGKGTVKILDMGLARIDNAVGRSSEGAGLTSTGTIMGTVDYMSPEQAMDTKHADARSDIYSLGCSLYYLLTGKAVYDGDTIMKKLMAHQNAPIPSITVNRTNIGNSGTTVDHGIDQVFRRMIAKSPDDRPQTMAEVIAQLERCLSIDGPPTVTYTNRSGSGSALLRAGDSATSKIVKGGSQTDVAEGAEFSETMNSTVGEANTDPQTSQSLSLERSATDSRLRIRKSRALLFGVATAVTVVVCGIAILMFAKADKPIDNTISVKPKGPDSHSETQSSITTPAGISQTIAEPAMPGAARRDNDFALQFDGVADRVVIPTLGYKGAEPITIEATIRTDGSQHQKSKVVTCPWGGVNLNENGHLRFGAWDPGAQARMVELVDPRPLPRDRKVHVAITWDLTFYRLFVDRQLVLVEQETPTFDTTDQNSFFLGGVWFQRGELWLPRRD